MSDIGGRGTADAPVAKALAFYLPQYHPIPENDAWWGKGFTEWLNVTRARPLYPGHYQPHVPGELGYYDLRVPEVRESQAQLARDHGLSGFVYYHYWFRGRRLLQRPFEEVLASGRPDFPFALCWANEEWTRNWDGLSGQVLVPQEYSDDDDLAHLRWLAEAFADPRYITIDGKPLFLVYRPMVLPDPRRTTDRWRAEAQKLGFPDLYLAWVEGWGYPPGGPEAFGFDATVGFMPRPMERLFTPLETVRGHRILDYVSAAEAHLALPDPGWRRFPSVMVGWDNTARRPRGATIYEGATPQAYGDWLGRTVASVADVREEERLVFLLAWNEWAEGNHLEPDLHHGRAFLEATRAVLLPGRADDGTAVVAAGGADLLPRDESPFDSAPARCARLVDGLVGTDRRAVVLGDELDDVEDACRVLGLAWRPVGVADEGALRSPGVHGALDKVLRSLDDIGAIGALILPGELEQMAEPHRVLAGLSAWALEHGSPALVVTVSNIAHFDRGLALLCGEWPGTTGGRRERSGGHPLTGDALLAMLERCGWSLVARSDDESVRSATYDEGLEDSIPEEMLGALRILAETYNPYAAVREFVWALQPVAVATPPRTLGEATAPLADDDRELPDRLRHPVDDYLASVGIVASEINRRAVSLRRLPPPRWKRAVQRTVYSSSTGATLYDSVRRWLR